MNTIFRLLAMTLMMTTSAWAQQVAQSHSPAVVVVPGPNGSDDTGNIQAALDACVTRGAGCSVQLGKGTYHTRQLVAYDFRGSFKGLGKERTTIEALPYLPVTTTDVFVQNDCHPTPVSCPWPSLIIFVDGDIRISDLTIKITASPDTATTGWVVAGSTSYVLVDAIRIMGQHPTDATIERIAVEGVLDESDPSNPGYNLINGILYTGELARSETPFDDYFLSGSLVVQNSTFKHMDDGVAADGFLRDVQILVGGHPRAGNSFLDIPVAIELLGADHSNAEVANNDISASAIGIFVLPWFAFEPKIPSQYLIHGNHVTMTAADGAGIGLLNTAASPWLRAAVYDNVVESSKPLSSGIVAVDTRSTQIFGNVVKGNGGDAISLWGSSLSSVIGNRVDSFVPDAALGRAQIYLNENTNHDLVICRRSTDGVLDLGSKNRVVGCRKGP